MWEELIHVFSSATQLCLTFCDPMDCSTPGFPLPYYLPKFAQTHVHWIGNAIQPFSSSVAPFSSWPPSFSASGLFQRASSLHQVAKVLEASASASVLPMNIQGLFSLGWTGLIFLQSKRLSRVFSSTTVWKHQFFIAQPSLWSMLGCTTKAHISLYVCLQDRRREFRNYS